MSTAAVETQELSAIQILLVEDNPLDATLVTGLLQKSPRQTRCNHARDLGAALAHLATRKVDVILLDLNLSDSSGYDTFARVRLAAPDAAILVLSGSDDEQLASRTVREGAQDYLVKGSFDGKLLLRAIRYALERKSSEEALRKSEATVRAIFENSLDAIVIFDENGRLVEANEAAAILLGASRTQLIGRALREFGSEGFHEESRRMRATLTGRGQFWVKRQDGGQRLVDYCFKANILPGRHLGVMRDITEQQNLEEQLRHSQKMEAVGRLAGSVAHDFNNILGVISGYAELIELRDSDEVLRGKAAKILAATTKAASLTRQLLAFGSKQVVAPKLLNLAEVVAELSSMLVCLVGVETQIDIIPCEGAPTIYADQGQMEQILLNLVTNAHEAMPYGGTVKIRIDNLETQGDADVPPGKYVRLSVSDTGTGIPPDIKSRIFDPFFTTKKTGSGLGLSTVFGIVKRVDGYISVESALERGTTFSVFLPWVQDASPEPSAPETLRTDAGGNETILMIDDEEELSNAAAEYLQQCGYRVLKARSAPEALELARKHPDKISLAIADIVIPGGSVNGLLDKIRQVHPEAGILLISGYADDAVLQHGFLNETSFLQKPFTLRALGVKIRALLDEARLRV